MAKAKDASLDDATDFRHLLEEIEQKHKAKLNALRRRIRTWDAVPRAEAWLEYIVEHESSGWGDEEALTYLVSSGRALPDAIERCRATWREAADKEIQSCARGRIVHKIPDTGQSEYLGGMPMHEAEQIRCRSLFDLPNFWVPLDFQEFHIDACMLRAAETCEIGGFEEWWERLFEETNDAVLTGMTEPIPISYWLFAMVRSRMARLRINSALSQALAKLNVKECREEPGPWRFLNRWDDCADSPRVATHNGFAANLAFSSAKLDRQSSPTAIGAAVELVKRQHEEGWWPVWSQFPEPSVDTTTRAILALMALRPMGYTAAVEKAIAWLRTCQTEYGYWSDKAERDVVFLTVLVLVALKTKAAPSNTVKTVDEPFGPFQVALSFPGDARSKVEDIANILRERLPHGSVFYDNFYPPQLARPNLDVFLLDLYRNRSKLVVVFVSETYQHREWCGGVEWRAIRDLIKSRDDKRVMIIRLDDGSVDGLLSIDGYIDSRHFSAKQLAEFVLERLATL